MKGVNYFADRLAEMINFARSAEQNHRHTEKEKDSDNSLDADEGYEGKNE